MGTGFKGEPVLNFDPPIWSPANYTLEVVSDSELRLKRVEGSMWNRFVGALVVKGINVGDGDVSFVVHNRVSGYGLRDASAVAGCLTGIVHIIEGNLSFMIYS